MKKKYDLIIIGSGVAGSKTAFECHAKGLKTAVIDKNPFGGTCSQKGCDPKKILMGAAEIMDRAELMSGKGINSKKISINWKELMQFKRTFTEPVPRKTIQNFHKAGIDTFRGTAFFTGKNTIKVNEQELEGKKILIAAGQKPADLKIKGRDFLITYEGFLDLDKLPENIIFIGGGYIAFEFASIASRAGTRVHIIHDGKSPLEKFDKDLVNLLVKNYRKYGIKISVNTKVTGIKEINNKFIVYCNTNGKEKTYKCDLAVHAAGRIPDIDELNLKAGMVKRDKRGIIVNQFMQSVSNPRVYSAGDSASGRNGIPLTPVAGKGAEIVIRNILYGNSAKADFNITPSVVFTLPVLASAGLTEEQAMQKKIKYMVNFGNSSKWYSTKRLGMKNTGFKILLDSSGKKILGAHLLSGNSEEVINLFSLAMSANLNIEAIDNMIFSYPTHSSDISYMLNKKDFKPGK